MALFVYQAFSKDGKKDYRYYRCTLSASAKEQLSKQGIYPISLSPARPEALLPWWKRILSQKRNDPKKKFFLPNSW